MGVVTWVDWAIWVVYFTFIFVVLVVYRLSKTENHYRFFLFGFVLKVFGGLGFAIIYIYYYKYGDTFLYHRGATVLSQTFLESPADYFRLLSSSNGNLPPDLSEFSTAISYSRGAEEWFMVKLLSPITFVAFHSYLVLTLFLSLISFYGGWKLFLVFKDLMPKRENLAFIAVFLLPSVLFSGGGVMKDTFTLAGINIIIYGLYFTLFKRQVSLAKYGLIMVAAYVVFYLKSYVLIAFVPGLLFGLNALIKERLNNPVLRRSLGTLFLLITVGIIYTGPRVLADTSSKYTAAAITGRVKGFHTWHTDVGGATYNLGEMNYTPLGVIQKIPAALNVTFFRPYLWESSSVVVLISGLESFALLLFFVYVLYKLRWKIFRHIREEPILITFLIYCLIFGFVVGFTSYNFGALGRYKIPVYSLFVFLLFYLFGKVRDQKNLG